MRLRVFLDTSALFAGTWSAQGGGRAVLRLGESRAIQLVVTAQVLAEIEEALRRKAPDLVAQVALLLAKCHVETTPPAPSPGLMAQLAPLVGRTADAAILAGAAASGIDFFVTHDDKHFLSNPALKVQLPFPIGDPGAFLSGTASGWSGLPQSVSEKAKEAADRHLELQPPSGAVPQCRVRIAARLLPLH